jgi:hypothetical protein
MPKDNDEGNKRIEGIFGQIGLGNIDPERINEFIENYERAMQTADAVRNRTGKTFDEVLNPKTEEPSAEPKDEPQEGEESK